MSAAVAGLAMLVCDSACGEEQRSETGTQFVSPSLPTSSPAFSLQGTDFVDALDSGSSSTDADSEGHFVVAPLPFSNELIGVGLVLGAGYVYSPAERTEKARHSVLGAGGMYADSGSWAAMVGHRGYWASDRYRSTVGAVTGSLVYNLELNLAGATRKFGIAQSFKGAVVDGAKRIGSSAWLGVGFLYGTTSIDVKLGDPPPIDAIEPDTTIDMSNLLLKGEWDTRDSDFYPRTGHFAAATATLSREDFGSQTDYDILEVEYNGYRSIEEDQVLAWRAYAKVVGDDAPFFAMAWFGSGCDLRGYTPGRYIGKSLFAAQVEWRWRPLPRWGFVAFGGAGTVSGTIDDTSTDNWLPAAGAGVRFKLIKSMDLNLRADVAWGRDDQTFTLSVGEAF